MVSEFGFICIHAVDTHKEQVKCSSNNANVASAAFVSHFSIISDAFCSFFETFDSCSSKRSDLRLISSSLFANIFSRVIKSVDDLEAREFVCVGKKCQHLLKSLQASVPYVQ
jgi:hypothetical protein